MSKLNEVEEIFVLSDRRHGDPFELIQQLKELIDPSNSTNLKKTNAK